MYLFLIIPLVCGTIIRSDDSSDSEDDGKFIDLLPEDEKQAFIESVARRLIDGVKTRENKYKSDETVSEESLNKHSRFVNKIIQEESGNLKRDSKSNADSFGKVSVGDKNFRQTKVQEEHIDLTRQGNRRKRDKKSEEFVPVPTVYDDENDRPVPKMVRNNRRNKASSREQKVDLTKERKDAKSREEKEDVRKERNDEEPTGSKEVETKGRYDEKSREAKDDATKELYGKKSREANKDFSKERHHKKYDVSKEYYDVKSRGVKEDLTKERYDQKSTEAKEYVSKERHDEKIDVSKEHPDQKSTEAREDVRKERNDEKKDLNKERYDEKSKEAKEDKQSIDENSTKEDIQVRGHRHLRGSSQVTTERPSLRSDGATKMEDFDPEDSNGVARPEKSIEEHTEKYYPLQSSEKPISESKPSYKDVTQPIYEPQGSGNEIYTDSNESVETVIETNSIMLVDTSPTTLKKDTTTIKIETQKVTAKKPILRNDSDIFEHKIVTVPPLNETRKMNSSNKTEEGIINLNVTTSRFDDVSDDYLSTDNIPGTDNVDNNKHLRTNDKNETSDEHETSTINDRQDVTEEVLQTTDSDDTMQISDDTTTIPPSSSEVQENIELVENSEENKEKVPVNAYDVDKDNKDITSTSPSSDELTDTTTTTTAEPIKQDAVEPNSDELTDTTTTNTAEPIKQDSAEPSSDQLANTTITTTAKTIKQDAVEPSTDELIDTTTTTPDQPIKQDAIRNNDTKYDHLREGPTIAERSDESSTTKEFVEKNSKLSAVNNDSESREKKYERANITKEYKTISNNSKSDTNETKPKKVLRTRDEDEKPTYIEFEDISKYQGNVLTTTEKNADENETKGPKYSIFYTKYVNNTEDDKSDCKSSEENRKENNENESLNEKNKKEKDANEEIERQGNELKNIAKALRQGLPFDEFIQNNFDVIQEAKPKLVEPSGKIKEYLVFEILPNQAPFVQRKPKPKPKPEPILDQREQPYYIPVYNYAPNNAYYNAHNRLGPNDDDNNDDLAENIHARESIEGQSTEDSGTRELDGHRKFKFNSNKPKVNYKEAQKSTGLSNFVPLPVVINPPKLTEVYFKPDEYLDMDYYFERPNVETISRTRKKQRLRKRKRHDKKRYNYGFKEDKTEPFYTMNKKGVKMHINAVRQMLYQQKHFGFIPEITSPTDIEETKGKVFEDQVHDKTVRSQKILRSGYVPQPKNAVQDRDIALDYYFGTQNSDDENNRKRYEESSRNKHFMSKGRSRNEKNSTDLWDWLGRLRRLIVCRSKNCKNEQELEGEEKEEKIKRPRTIKEILDIGDISDAFQNLEKLKNMGIPLVRRYSNDVDIQVYVNVLKDMLKMKNRALEKFDWLGSTVDILGAVKKLRYLTENQYSDSIHPADIQLLNYVQYLYKISNAARDEEFLRKKKKKNIHLMLPRNKHRIKHYLNMGHTNALFKYIRLSNGTHTEVVSLEVTNPNDFLIFLDDLKDSLFDLHKAMKYIAMVTDYKNQQWLTNIQSLYLNKDKEIMELLLHIFTTRLLENIDKCTENVLKEGYLRYVEKNQKEVERFIEEFQIVFKLVEEIKKR